MARLVKKEDAGKKTVVVLETSHGFYVSANGIINHNCDFCRNLWHAQDNINIPKPYKLQCVLYGTRDIKWCRTKKPRKFRNFFSGRCHIFCNI